MSYLDYIKQANDAFISHRRFVNQYNDAGFINELRYLSKVYRSLEERCREVALQVELEQQDVPVAPAPRRGGRERG